MTHLGEGQILILRDEAGGAPGEDRAHVAECPACSEALESARAQAGTVARALEALDATSAKEADAARLERARERVRARVTAHAAQAAGAIPLRARAPRRAVWTLSRAAGILLVTAAGVSALPGSPVRRWVEDLLAPAPEAAPAPAAAPAPEAAAPAPPPEEAGVRLPLAAGPLAVVLRGAAPGTEIRVTWIPGREAALFAPVGSRFTSGEGHLEASLAPGRVRVELPRGVSPLSLEADGTVLLRITPAGLEVTGAVAERGDSGITFVIPGR